MILLEIVLGACFALVVWNVFAWPAVKPGKGCPGEVSVLIPARNEEGNLDACLDCVLAEDGVKEVLIYDDHSSDATAKIAAARAARDPRVVAVKTQPLPVGWCGKTFACAQLAESARSEWLLFLDADARLARGAVAGMVSEAQARSATLLSCWPGLEMRGFWEKLLMPMLNFVVFSLYPARLGVSRRDPSLGLAHGACILANRKVYDAVGGHSAVAGEIFEDTRLARFWRERGERSLCLDGQHVIHVRMYSGAKEIWSGFQKNFRAAFRTEAAFWAFLMLHAVVFLAPFLWAAPAALLVTGMRVLLAFRFRHPLWSALLHPAGECFVLVLGLASWWAWEWGSGVEWRGRRYRQA